MISAASVDCYFDTADGRLQSRKIALRLREVPGATLISLKGRQRRASTRTEDRLEIEAPLSEAAIEEVARRTRLRGTRPPAQENETRFPDQLEEWPYAKLPTGRAIEELLVKDRLTGLRSDGVATPESYEQIRRYLNRRDRRPSDVS